MCLRVAPLLLLLRCLLTLAADSCVFLTVSSSPHRKLTISWNSSHPVDLIEVYADDPDTENEIAPQQKIAVGGDIQSSLVTDIDFKGEQFPGGWDQGGGPRVMGDHCLPPWVSASHNGTRLGTACISIRPAWMHLLRNDIGKASLPDLFLPGTHNSGCLKVQALRRRRGGQLDSWAVTQDQSVWNQLVYGIRYLDLRVGNYPKQRRRRDTDAGERFWVNHDMVRMQPLVPVLRQVAAFLEASPTEVVVLDFHRFPVGFKPPAVAAHLSLIETIRGVLGQWAVPRPPSQGQLTLNDIWATDRRVVISYSEEAFVTSTDWLWHSIPQHWGNKQRLGDLRSYLDGVFHGEQPPVLRAAMAELTPTPFDFLVSNSSLRAMAQEVNSQLGGWFEAAPWRDRANIVATDFFLGNSLISKAVNINRARSAVNHNKHTK